MTRRELTPRFFRTLRRHAPLLAVLAVAALWRAALLALDAFSFNADEAVVALMARHMLAGRGVPTFFYGQAYMGSLDAILVAAGFALLGDSVLTVRIVQSALYLGVVASTYGLALRLSGRRWVAAVAGLLTALPPTVAALYTTATLGGYNETLLLGNAILWLGYDVTHGRECSRGRWALLGVLAGLGWWTNGLIVVYYAPVALMLAHHADRARWREYGLAAAGVLLGSAPWWAYNLRHGWAALEVYLHSRRADNTGVPSVPLGQRVLGLLLFGVPSLLGVRYPWAGTYVAPPLAVLMILGFWALLWRWARRGGPTLRAGARGLLLSMVALLGVIFVASPFSADPTGRYFLPLWPVLAILWAAQLADWRKRRRRWAQAGAAGVALLWLLTVGAVALHQPPGLTTQFDLISDLPHEYDDPLIAFLEARGLTRGYSNYWVAFRLAYLTHERIVLSAALPYKADLSYNPADRRYPPYDEAVARAEAVQIAYITSNLPALDARIRACLRARGVHFAETQIGPYRVFYNFSAHIPPQALGIFQERGCG